MSVSSLRVAAVEFVGVGAGGDVFWAGGVGWGFEVWVVEGVDGIDAFAPVEEEEGAQEGNCLGGLAVSR